MPAHAFTSTFVTTSARACGALSLVFGTACSAPEHAGSEPPLTFEQFQAQAHYVPETGTYLVNGDEPAQDLDELHSYYDEYLSSLAETGDIATFEQPLIVNRYGPRRADDVWTATEALALTYCIDGAGFGNNLQAVIDALSTAAEAWEGVANVDFTDNSVNGACPQVNSNLFRVRQTTSPAFLATSFFPHTRPRVLLISRSAFGNIAPVTLTGLLTHEFGHVLGFRHEHTRPEAGACFEDNNWRALTEYDSNSVMHYPQCNGTNEGDLVLTEFDQTGAALLYP